MFSVRADSSDQNSVQSAVTEDEYGLADLYLEDGYALDVGAHVGSVAVALALDNPQAHIIAVEPVPENAALVRHNAERNGVADRVLVLEAAVGKAKVTIRFDYSGSESALHHRYIGNSTLNGASKSRSVTYPGLSLEDLVKLAGGHVAFAKVDCESCEYDLLDSPAVKDVDEVRGEYHRGSARILTMLTPTHATTVSDVDFGHFTATRA